MGNNKILYPEKWIKLLISIILNIPYVILGIATNIMRVGEINIHIYLNY
jgi:hypothetical protein